MHAPHRRSTCGLLPAAMLVLLLASSATSGVGAQGLPRAAPQDVGLSAEVLGRIAPAMRAYVDSGKLAGVVVAVARQGKLAYIETFGHADVAGGTPLTTDAVFRIYSMTKPVTAVAVLQLVERGKLGLDDPVSRYVPAFADVRVYAGGGVAQAVTSAPARAITIRDLLAHTSGMAYGLGRTPPDSLVNDFVAFRGSRTVAGFSDSIARIPLLFSPGERWSYGPGLEVLGRVVEVASGRPFDRYLEEEIFAPLEMRSTRFRLTPAMRTRLAVLYAPGDDKRLRPVPVERVIAGDNFEPGARFVCGGCGLLSTAGDYLRFAQMLLNGGTLDGHRILRPETVAEMRRNALPPALVPIPAFLQGPGVGFGLGVSVQVDTATARNPSAPGTFGWAGAANTYFWIDPANDLIGMIWTQHLPPFAYPLQTQAKGLVYDALVARPAP